MVVGCLSRVCCVCCLLVARVLRAGCPAIPLIPVYPVIGRSGRLRQTDIRSCADPRRDSELTREHWNTSDNNGVHSGRVRLDQNSCEYRFNDLVGSGLAWSAQV